MSTAPKLTAKGSVPPKLKAVLPLVWELVRRRVAVRALVHRAANASLLPAKGLQVLVGDLRHQATVNKAVAGVNRVFVLSPVGPDVVAKESALISACERHGVAHVVKLSALVASLLPADLLIILTSVDGLIENFGKPDAQTIGIVETIDQKIEQTVSMKLKEKK